MPKRKSSTSPLGEHPATARLIQRAMNRGVRKAIAEKDRHGVPSVGTVDGRIVYRQSRRGIRNEQASRSMVDVNLRLDGETATALALLLQRVLVEDIARAGVAEARRPRDAVATLQAVLAGQLQVSR